MLTLPAGSAFTRSETVIRVPVPSWTVVKGGLTSVEDTSYFPQFFELARDVSGMNKILF